MLFHGAVSIVHGDGGVPFAAVMTVRADRSHRHGRNEDASEAHLPGCHEDPTDGASLGDGDAGPFGFEERPFPDAFGQTGFHGGSCVAEGPVEDVEDLSSNCRVGYVGGCHVLTVRSGAGSSRSGHSSLANSRDETGRQSTGISRGIAVNLEVAFSE